MADSTLAIRLSADIEKRLNNLAKKTGQTKSALAREAIAEFICALENYYLAEARDLRNRKGISLAEVERRLGI